MIQTIFLAIALVVGLFVSLLAKYAGISDQLSHPSFFLLSVLFIYCVLSFGWLNYKSDKLRDLVEDCCAGTEEDEKDGQLKPPTPIV